MLFDQYDFLTRDKLGWSLTEIRALTPRERRYWLEMALARRKNG